MVTSSPIDPSSTLVPGGPHQEQRSIYLVTIPSGAVRYIATLSLQTCLQLSGTAQFVAWRNTGSSESSDVLLYSRTNQIIHGLGASFNPVFSASGLLAAGLFGIHALVDPNTREYVVILPSGGPFDNWSPDFRFASTGYFAGRGGC